MNYRTLSKDILRIFLSGILCMGYLSCGDKEPPPPLQYSGENPRVQHPLSPEDSQKHIQLPEGFYAELYASEPDIINPIAFTWDERGRLWVVQSMDYPHGLDNDVGGDRITICEDTDGDGRADHFTDFATDQKLSTGIVLVKGGAIVAQAPNMVFLEDTDGDDRMDKQTVLFDGFGTWDTHAGPSSLRYGIDNMIWGAVGYSGFENKFREKEVSFEMGVYRFNRTGTFFEPIGQFNNNTWGMGYNEDFEIFGSTANNNHACYVGIPLRHYEYLDKMPGWAKNAGFIQGHYDISPADTIPLQQVDVRGGYTAAAGANFYTATNYPEQYRNQMYVNEPTGHLVHIARIEQDGAAYKEVDGGNIFASTDAWTSPVFTETGPDGNLWVADWYNPVIQHNPDNRGMDNQIWNAIKGEGNAHINELRDYGHGRIYIVKHEDAGREEIRQVDAEDGNSLIRALQSDNLFWRITAQRLIVENDLKDLIPQLRKMAEVDNGRDAKRNPAALHALWSLDGLGVLEDDSPLIKNALTLGTYDLKRAALTLLPDTGEGSDLLAASGLLSDSDPRLRMMAIVRASELPESPGLYRVMELVSRDNTNLEDPWINAAIKLYFREPNYEAVDPSLVQMMIPSAQERSSVWKYTTVTPDSAWFSTGFNDGDWETGSGIFGGDKDEKIKTAWTAEEIWLRKSVKLSEIPSDPVLKVLHDDDYEVYINGQLLIGQTGASGSYKYIRLDPEKSSLFRKGKNLIAVHCKNTGGNQHIDLGIGNVGKPPVDVTFSINTVSQEMAYDKTVLYAEAGQTVEIKLSNKDQMPHNLVVLSPASLQTFGTMVDDFVNQPEAEEMGYVPKSRYVLGATEMLGPDQSGSVVFKLPDTPGRYPFVCTFPGHWRLMQGVIIVRAPGSYISENKDADDIVLMGGGGSHDFLKYFGIADGQVLSQEGANNVIYTEDTEELGNLLQQAEILVLSNNKPLDQNSRDQIFSRLNSGQMDIMVYHPSTWYNWQDWPEYNKNIVGGGSRSHEDLQEFEVRVLQPDHPLMTGVPARFSITDELYRWEKDADAEIEVLAVGRGLESGEEYPVVWVVKHPVARIIGNTLGHDARAHNHPAYKTILQNSLDWIKN